MTHCFCLLRLVLTGGHLKYTINDMNFHFCKRQSYISHCSQRGLMKMYVSCRACLYKNVVSRLDYCVSVL